MADAGRILIIPRGDYNANSTYEKLDLVKYKGASWLAKKNATGVEPSEGEYWQKLFYVDIANNLTTTSEGYALDARQGKVLNDKIDLKLNCIIYSLEGLLSANNKTTDNLSTMTTKDVFKLMQADSQVSWEYSVSSNKLIDAISIYGAIRLTRIGKQRCLVEIFALTSPTRYYFKFDNFLSSIDTLDYNLITTTQVASPKT